MCFIKWLKETEQILPAFSIKLCLHEIRPVLSWSWCASCGWVLPRVLDSMALMIRRRQSESARFICQSPVPLLQDECCSFRLPLSGENTLLVPNHTGQPCRHKRDQQEAWLRCGGILLLEANWALRCFCTLYGHEVGKVPDEFPDDVLLPLLVEHAVVALQDNILVLLSKHHRWILESEKTASYPQY